jgi:hypothetical protein
LLQRKKDIAAPQNGCYTPITNPEHPMSSTPFANPFASLLTPDAFRAQATQAIAASEKLVAEQLAAVEDAQARLRAQSDAAMQHSLAATRIGIDAMLASQKALLDAVAPASK